MAIPDLNSLLNRVLDEWSLGEDERFNELIASLLKHLHEFAWETRLSQSEWAYMLKFLEKTGKLCTSTRNEYQLLSDVLGFTSAVNLINQSDETCLTESAVIGPFYVENSPVIPSGGSLIRQQAPDGDQTLVKGRVLCEKGLPIAGALLDIWQTSPNSLYAVQDSNQDPDNLRARIYSNEDGSYSFITYKPCAYPIPRDGTVGELLGMGRRHGMRPAHIHFIVSAPGYETVATQLFSDDDPYLWGDAVFAEKESLVVTYQSVTGVGDMKWKLDFDFRLKARSSKVAVEPHAN